jgi:hypothetical protein
MLDQQLMNHSNSFETTSVTTAFPEKAEQPNKKRKGDKWKASPSAENTLTTEGKMKEEEDLFECVICCEERKMEERPMLSHKCNKDILFCQYCLVIHLEAKISEEVPFVR